MDWWAAILAGATVFLRRHGLLAACAALLVEEAGVPLPILPGDVVMLAVGIQAREGLVPLWAAIGALEVVTVVGASVLYFIARRAGRGLVYRYGRYLQVTPDRLAEAEMWLHRRGGVAVAVMRLIPGLRIATAIGCGVLAVPFRTYLPAIAAGAAIYITIYTLIGYYFGQTALAIFERVHIPLEVVGSLAVLIAGTVWLVSARRALPLAADEHAAVPAGPRRRLAAGVTAGATATLGAALFMNALIPIAGDIASQSPFAVVVALGTRLPAAVARRFDPAALLVGAALFVAGGLVWGAVYGRWVERRLRRQTFADWAKGLLFALGPFAISLLLVLPVLELVAFRQRGAAVIVGGEVLFHVVYGIVLGLTYPVFLTRPARRTRHRHPHLQAAPELTHVA